MARNLGVLPPRVAKTFRFYAYVLRGVLNLPWTVEVMQNPVLTQITKDYLSSVCDDEWEKIKILDLIRDKKRVEIKEETRRALPSLFEDRGAWPLIIPKELPNVKLDLELINSLKIRIEEQKAKTGEEVMDTTSENSVVENKTPRLSIPANVPLANLTLANFSTLTGRRFRVTTEQQARIKAGTLTREQAFQEFLKELGS